MTAIISATTFALLFWLARKDGYKLFPSDVWDGLIILLGSVVFWYQTDHWINLGLAVIAWWAIITSPHNWLLSRQTQTISEPRDLIQKALLQAFSKAPGEQLGLPLYVTYSVVRYALPVAILGCLTGNLWLVYAAPLASLIYYPWIEGDGFKVLRALMLGALVGLALVLPFSAVSPQ